jgi:hypothetical protein
MSGNRLKFLPGKLFEHSRDSKLATLDLSSNQIRELPSDIFKPLKNLGEINMDNNELTFLPGSLFDQNLDLHKISFQRNRLNGISSIMFQHLRDLDSVDFEDNDCISSSYYDLKSYSYQLNEFRNSLKDRCSFGYLQVEMKSMIENYAKMTEFVKIYEGKVEDLEKNLSVISTTVNRLQNLTEVQRERIEELENGNGILAGIEINATKAENTTLPTAATTVNLEPEEKTETTTPMVTEEAVTEGIIEEDNTQQPASISGRMIDFQAPPITSTSEEDFDDDYDQIGLEDSWNFQKIQDFYLS